MRYVFILICCVALAGRVSAQDVADAKQTGKASLEGRIIQEPGGEPVKKAIVELIAENQEEGGNYTAISNQDGRFEIRGILPGRYRMFTERTGFIEVDHRRRRSQGISLSFDPGQEVNDQTLHMLAAAVLIGRVQDEDGDPMTDAEVKVFRRRFGSGGVKFEPVGGTQTNDLGEFRMGGLLADKYFVSVAPPVPGMPVGPSGAAVLTPAPPPPPAEAKMPVPFAIVVSPPGLPAPVPLNEPREPPVPTLIISESVGLTMSTVRV